MVGPGAVAFFDIGNTLASVRVSADGREISDLVVYPFVPGVLEDLRDKEVRLGILSNRGAIPEDSVNAALEHAGLLPFFDRDLILYGPKDSTLLFEQAAVVAQGVTGDRRTRLLFVGEDATERTFARRADFMVAPHPSLALTVLEGDTPLRYLRIRVPGDAADGDWRSVLRSQPVVPLHITAPDGDAAWVEMYAVANATTALKLDDLGFFIDRLGRDDDPLTTDLYLLRDDRKSESGFGSDTGNSFDLFGDDLSARRVLSSAEEGLFIAIPAGGSVERYHFRGARHGHNLKLLPAPSLLDPRASGGGSGAPEAATLSGEAITAASSLTTAEREIIERHVTTARIKREVARYSGVEPVTGDVRIRSRHIHHPDNASVVRALLDDVTTEGAGRLTVRTHQFTHEGRPYENVEAVLPGSGVDGVVLVTAHLDSTAARQAGYRSSVDPAPGADDDGSGVAGVFATLTAILSLTDEIEASQQREVRFVFFNAEEHGLVGSGAYARDQALLDTDIVAMLQMDMIGHDVAPPAAFELHAGFTPSADVQTRSLRIAELMESLAPQMSPNLPPAQMYPEPDGRRDPAEERSDHYSFQLQGYAACLASEHFFAGPSPGAAPEPNPNYHLPADRTVNADYARDIARVVAAAAWMSMTR
ncbi:M28 family peptidase [Streptomyces sp. NPDC048483]|uniref:M28 family peptidase n=1 Tax=Streptomyces sp. NPDC048483 TaxID=3154927 RepID=UPI003440DF8A